MGSVPDAARRHFDLTMSKRTRKAFESIKDGEDRNHTRSSPSKEGSVGDEPDAGGGSGGGEEDRNDRKSLNQLISGCEGNEGKEKNSSLSQHFREEEEQQQQLQLVSKRSRKPGENGMKLKGMMGRYAKMLSNMIKANKHEAARLSSRKKPLILLKM